MTTWDFVSSPLLVKTQIAHTVMLISLPQPCYAVTVDDMEKAEKMKRRLKVAGRNLLTARTAERHIRDAAAALAAEAYATKDFSQHQIARLLGVDRMTIRNWLEKK